MAFKLKDLLIDVLHAGAHCGPATIEPGAAVVHCGPATIEPRAAAHCGPATIEPLGPDTVTPVTLETLKSLLRNALSHLEHQEREQQEKAQAATLPQTLAEAEDLESRLKAALVELAEHKKTLGS